MNDVCFTHPPGEAAGKGSTVRALRRYASWVQNVDILRWRGVTLLLVLAYIGETCVRNLDNQTNLHRQYRGKTLRYKSMP